MRDHLKIVTQPATPEQMARLSNNRENKSGSDWKKDRINTCMSVAQEQNHEEDDPRPS
jgi:hypothetical protein